MKNRKYIYGGMATAMVVVLAVGATLNQQTTRSVESHNFGVISKNITESSTVGPRYFSSITETKNAAPNKTNANPNTIIYKEIEFGQKGEAESWPSKLEAKYDHANHRFEEYRWQNAREKLHRHRLGWQRQN